MNPKSLNVEVLKLWLAAGWSINYALSKAKIHQREHSILLQTDPEYAAMINETKTKNIQKSRSCADHLIKKAKDLKNSLI